MQLLMTASAPSTTVPVELLDDLPWSDAALTHILLFVAFAVIAGVGLFATVGLGTQIAYGLTPWLRRRAGLAPRGTSGFNKKAALGLAVLVAFAMAALLPVNDALGEKSAAYADERAAHEAQEAAREDEVLRVTEALGIAPESLTWRGVSRLDAASQWNVREGRMEPGLGYIDAWPDGTASVEMTRDGAVLVARHQPDGSLLLTLEP